MAIANAMMMGSQPAPPTCPATSPVSAYTPVPRMSPTMNSTSSLGRSEEHTSELQSRGHLVCRLLLEKKKLEIQLIFMLFDLFYSCPPLLVCVVNGYQLY